MTTIQPQPLPFPFVRTEDFFGTPTTARFPISNGSSDSFQPYQVAQLPPRNPYRNPSDPIPVPVIPGGVPGPDLPPIPSGMPPGDIPIPTLPTLPGTGSGGGGGLTTPTLPTLPGTSGTGTGATEFSIEPYQRALGGTFEQQEDGSYIRFVEVEGVRRQDAGRYWARQGGALYYTGGNTFRPNGTAGPPANNVAQVYSVGSGGGLTSSAPTPFDAFLASARLIPGPNGGYVRQGDGNSGTWYLEPDRVAGNHVVSYSGGTVNGERVEAGTYSLTVTDGIPNRLNATEPTRAALVLAHTPNGGMRPVMNSGTLEWAQPSGFTNGTLTYQPADGSHGPRVHLSGPRVPPSTYYYADSPDPNNRVVLWVHIAAAAIPRPAAPAALGGSPTIPQRVDHYNLTSNSSGWWRAQRNDEGVWWVSYRSGATTQYKRYNFSTGTWERCGAGGANPS